jgi:outer membrane protein TolC
MGMMLAFALAVQPLALAAQDGKDSNETKAAAPPAAGPEGGREKFGTSMPDFTHGNSYWPNFVKPYFPVKVPGSDLSNSPRIEQLLRGGKIQLTLADAIALALENNLDVAVQRYSPLLADTDILRAQAGSGVRGTRGAVATGGGGGGGAASSAGSVTGSFDPQFTATFGASHSTFPVTSFVNRVVQGLTSIKSNNLQMNFAYTQAFHSGTIFSLNLNNSRSVNVQNTLNPQIGSNFTVQLSQNLLNGFGFANNRRGIKIARNNREVSDLVFKQQVMVTVTAVQNLYWDLVSAAEDVKVRERSLQVAEKLYNDNKRQVEIGTLAPIEVVRAEAEVAARRQDLIVSQSNLAQAGTSMKNLILRNISDNTILTAEVVPADRISVPPVEPVVPIQELVSTAMSARPELAQSRIDLNNRDINVNGTKNAMLPALGTYAYWSGRGVAGVDRDPRTGQIVATDLSGGLGRSYTQMWQSNNPDYGFGFQLTLNLKNRSAQADMAQALLDRRQADLRLRQQENGIRVEVQNALIALQSNRARIEAATKQRELAERSLDAEQKKFQLGASTNFQVIQAQRDLTAALSAEVAALNNYMKSRVELDRATGQTVVKNNISLEEAYQGHMTRLPTPTPVTRQD